MSGYSKTILWLGIAMAVGHLLWIHSLPEYGPPHVVPLPIDWNRKSAVSLNAWRMTRRESPSVADVAPYDRETIQESLQGDDVVTITSREVPVLLFLGRPVTLIAIRIERPGSSRTIYSTPDRLDFLGLYATSLFPLLLCASLAARYEAGRKGDVA